MAKSQTNLRVLAMKGLILIVYDPPIVFFYKGPLGILCQEEQSCKLRGLAAFLRIQIGLEAKKKRH